MTDFLIILIFTIQMIENMINPESGYIALSILMNFILFLIGISSIQSSFANPTQRKSKKVLLLVGLVLWQIYILIIGKSGILQDFSLPPRVLIFLVCSCIFIYCRIPSLQTEIMRGFITYLHIG
jgi:antibiotic biosynthesis monooxygenase (ABM) superfamily enzyme